MADANGESKEKAVHVYEDETGNVRVTISGEMKFLEAMLLLEMAGDLVKQKMLEKGRVIKPVIARPGLVGMGGN